jgi:hypothetical protein
MMNFSKTIFKLIFLLCGKLKEKLIKRRRGKEEIKGKKKKRKSLLN